MKFVALTVFVLSAALPSVASAEQTAMPRWIDPNTPVCPAGFEYSKSEGFCWDSEFFWRRHRQQQAAIPFLIVVGVGTVAGMYLGLRKTGTL